MKRKAEKKSTKFDVCDRIRIVQKKKTSTTKRLVTGIHDLAATSPWP